MLIATLESQRTLQDMRGLPMLVEEINWVSNNIAGDTPIPLLVCGLLAADDPVYFSHLLRERSDKGLGTLVIPRFRPCNLQQLLETPGDIEIRAAEYSEVLWQQESYQISGSVVFDTNLHIGRLAVLPGVGVQILAFRQTTAKGNIILCGPSIISNRLGCNVIHQKALLGELLQLLMIDNTDTTAGSDKLLSPAELLRENSEAGPLILIAYLAGAELKVQAIMETLTTLGIDVKESAVNMGILHLKPDISLSESRQALNEAGWSAFVRRLSSVFNNN